MRPELFLQRCAEWNVPHLLQVLRHIWQEPEKRGAFLYGIRRSKPEKQILFFLFCAEKSEERQEWMLFFC